MFWCLKHNRMSVKCLWGGCSTVEVPEKALSLIASWPALKDREAAKPGPWVITLMKDSLIWVKMVLFLSQLDSWYDRVDSSTPEKVISQFFFEAYEDSYASLWIGTSAFATLSCYLLLPPAEILPSPAGAGLGCSDTPVLAHGLAKPPRWPSWLLSQHKYSL